MTLSDLKKGEHARVLQTGKYQNSLFPFGMVEGKEVTLLKRSPLGHTLLLETEEGIFALSAKIAREVSVWKR